ncbi:MAG: 4Fe-4S binding protein [Anaerovoracaceae bacterium]
MERRTIIQIISTALANGYLIGFMKGKIYQGDLKAVCVPGLNCYSCPGAIGSCPIGAVQAVIGGKDKNFAFYAIGVIILFGVIFGRLICGFLCPFGFLQDLLYKIKTPKLKVPDIIDKYLRYLKYIMLVVLVIGLPMIATNAFGMSDPFFCKWVCPVGTLEGGIPLVLTNASLRNSLGFLFGFKMFILVGIILLSIVVYRPFCKYLCPLGACYGLLNKYSFYQMKIDTDKCTSCNACNKACKMNVNVTKNINSPECIRCGLCKSVCKSKAIESGFNLK